MGEVHMRLAEHRSLAQDNFVAVANEDLPVLTGSEKQIAWATRIRASMVKLAAERCYRGPYATYRDAEAERHLAARALLNAMMDHTDAAWWIDHQGSLRSLDADYQRHLTELQRHATA